MIEGEWRTDCPSRFVPDGREGARPSRFAPDARQRTSRRTVAQGQTIIWYNLRVMTMEERVAARADIEATGDLLERALKLAGLLATLFQECGYPLVVVGGSAVEFYTEGG